MFHQSVFTATLLALIGFTSGVAAQAESADPSAGASDDATLPAMHRESWTLEISSAGEPLEGHGPATSIEIESRSRSVIFVWAEAESFRPYLRLEKLDGSSRRDLRDFRLYTTPCVYTGLDADDRLRISIAAPREFEFVAETSERVELHVVHIPETQVNFTLNSWLSESRTEIAALRDRGEGEAAALLLLRRVDDLLAMNGASTSACILIALALLVGNDDGHEVPALEASVKAWRHCSDRLGDWTAPRSGYRVNYLENLGFCLRWLERTREALEVFHERFEVIVEGREFDDKIVLETTEWLTNQYMLAGFLDEAEALWMGVLEKVSNQNQLDDAAAFLIEHGLGFIAAQRPDFVQSRRWNASALEHMDRLQGVSALKRADTLHRLSTASGELGDRRVFREAIDRAYAIVMAELPPGNATRLHVLKVHARRWQDVTYSECAERLQRILEECEQTDKETLPIAISARCELGAALRVSDPSAARRSVLRGYELANRHLAITDIRHARAVEHVVEVFDVTGDGIAALVLVEDYLARVRAELPPDHRIVGMATRQLVYLILRRGTSDPDVIERALSLLADCERIYAPFYPVLSQQRLRLRQMRSQLLGFQGKYAEARDLLREVYEQASLAPHLNTAGWFDHILEDLARNTSEAGDTERGVEILEGIVARHVELPAKNLDKLASQLLRLAKMLASIDRIEDSQRILAQGFDVLQRVLDSCRLDPPAAAWRRAGTMHGELGGNLALAHELGLMDRLARPAFEAVEAMRLVSFTALVSEEPDEALDALRVRRLDLASRLSTMVGTPEAGLDEAERSKRLVELSTERDRVESLIAERLALHGERRVRPDSAALAERLGSTDALVSFRVIHGTGLDHVYRMMAIVVQRDASVQSDSSVQWLDLGDVGEVSKVVQEWRGSIGRPLDARGVVGADEESPPDADSLEFASERLRELVLDPVLQLVGDVKRLYVALDHALVLVPLEALPDPEGPGVLGDRIEFHQLLSMADLMERRSPTSDKHLLVAVGGVEFSSSKNPEGSRSIQDPSGSTVPLNLETAAAGIEALAATRWSDGDFEPLPGTLREVEAIADRFVRSHDDGELLLLKGPLATKASLIEHLSSARYVHIATHGWFAPLQEDSHGHGEVGSEWHAGVRAIVSSMAPMALCGLALAGANGEDRGKSILTAEELAGLDLWGCELAVLSACETNVGLQRSGQGIQSLQAALHNAGVRATITSLWKVDDAATTRLMDRFYENLWKKNQPMRAALWSAKKSLREEGAPLRDWSGWVLMGD